MSSRIVFAQNPKYKDGTRLRATSEDAADFNGVWVPNDTQLAVLKEDGNFLLVQKPDGESGWIRTRNVAAQGRVSGVTKGLVTSEMVTPDPEYIRGLKIYNCGIKADPVPGCKFGKGLQHLISSQWLNTMSQFIAAHLTQVQAFVRHAYHRSQQQPGYDFTYLINVANHLILRAEASGLKSSDSIDLFHMGTYLVMAASEVDDFNFSKYSKAERAVQREAFYRSVLEPAPGPGTRINGKQGKPSGDDDDEEEDATLGLFATPSCRRDLIPPIAIERLGINNELSALKYVDPTVPMREGFLLSTRIDSLKRHFEGVHRRQKDEDHIIHLLWNCHAIFHVLTVFPDKNDLIDYTQIHLHHVPTTLKVGYEPTTSLQKIQVRHAPLHEVFKLDWNEGVIPPPKSVSEALMRFVREAEGGLLKWYPHLSGGAPLREKICAYSGSILENILVTNGSDDALILLCHCFAQSDTSKTSKVLAPSPTYEHFCVNAVAAGASLVRVAFQNPFIADHAALVASIEAEQPDLVYLVSPCNPTGVEWPPRVVEGMANRFPSTTFIVDEAYVEFGTPKESPGVNARPITCAPLARSRTNVIVTRTFSKAFCLASVRCGYVIAHPSTIERLKFFYNPKSVNMFAQIAAAVALDEYESYYAPYIHLVNTARATFIETLTAAGVDVRTGGAGNFVCIRVPVGREVALCDALESKGIYIRDVGKRFPGYVRVTIGIQMERVAEALVEAVRSILRESSPVIPSPS